MAGDTVEELRAKHENLRPGKLPLDLISFVELDLRLDLIPYDGLRRDLGADAAILADFSGLYVDGETYDMIDTARDWQLNRLRFSIAHEIGHLMLHREAFESAGISCDADYLRWLNAHHGRKYQLEREANEFAGRLLVPVEVLRACFERLHPALDELCGRHQWVSDERIRTKTAERIAPRFGVLPMRNSPGGIQHILIFTPGTISNSHSSPGFRWRVASDWLVRMWTREWLMISDNAGELP